MDILFEDEHCLAVSKPAMLSTQAPPIAGATLEFLVRSHLNPAAPASAYAGTVHRLDRPVSGVVLWAKTRRDARRLSQQFERRQVEKVYWALVEGQVQPAEGRWEDWLVREDTGLGRVQTCLPGTPRSQRALTTYQRQQSTTQLPPCCCSWVELHPETGRMHQLRVQAAHHGWPILGDALYGAQASFPLGIALHARSLAFRHPALGTLMRVEAPLPPSWAEAGFKA